jgi:hypothetical protein
MQRMAAIPWRVQIGVVVAGYASVLTLAAVLIFVRHEQYVRHPEDVAASGGMYAAGDWMLAMFIGFMLLCATILLAFAIRNAESAYTHFSQILFGLSLTAPVCLGLLSIPAVGQSNSIWGFACLFRIGTAPVMVVGFVISRLLAKFRMAKRLTSAAIVVEVLTLGIGIAGAVLSAVVRR